MTREDLGEIKKEINAWGKRLPSEAQAFHFRCAQLMKQIDAATGSFGRNASADLQIQKEFQELRTDLPKLIALNEAVQRTRPALAELNVMMKRTQEDWSAGWLDLLDHIVRVVADGKRAVTGPFDRLVGLI